MKMLKNKKDVDALMAAVAKCTDAVILRSADGKEEYNLKSALSEIMGIAHLLEEHGEDYEVFCMNKADEGQLLSFFHNLRQGDTPAA